jgi:hypothetical protein
MRILASWKQQRRAERRAERLAKAQSDEIDRQLRTEWKCRVSGKQHDILLLGSCFPSSFPIRVVVRADCGRF